MTTAGGGRRAAAPFGLWVRGDLSLEDVGRRSVSIVGARASSAYGEHMAGELAATCGARGLAVVSGGAYGIDAAAHRGALVAPAPTVAVLAGGIDRLYPAGNTSLLRTIAREGAVIAEAAPGCIPTKSRFLVRNRIIAALSLGTVVVEAALRSGALSTARWARDLDRQVMGVPGPVTSMTSAGVHELLRQPGSVLVTDADEVIEQISPIGEGLAARKSGTTTVRDGLDVLARLVLDAVPRFTAAEAESIATVAGLPMAETARCLEQLAAAGLVEGGQDGVWRLVPN
jgi:DNA processing protein